MAASAVMVELGRAERNKRDKRARLVRAARTLFQRKGFHQTTTSEIAELADVGKGTLFFYARTKEDLLVMVFQEEVGRAVARAFATVPDVALIDQLVHVFGVMIEQNQRDLELARVFVKEMAFVTGDRRGIDAVMTDLFGRMRALIERAQQRGEIASAVKPALLAYNLFALYFSFLTIWLGSGARSPNSANPSLRQMLELQLLSVSGAVAAPPGKRTRNRLERLSK